MPPEHWRYACPECGSRQIYPLTESDAYRCDYCNATEFEPVDLKEAEGGNDDD